jgi:hypothetical protein
MRVATGFLDKEGTPRLQFELAREPLIQGVSGTKIEGIMDTGFVGFVSMPLRRVFALKLPLAGESVIRLADGKSPSFWIRAPMKS